MPEIIATLTFDQVDQFEKETGLKWNVKDKMCDFCDKLLPLTHTSKTCTICPTIFDECDACKGHDMCHKDHTIDYKVRTRDEIDQIKRHWKSPDIHLMKFVMNTLVQKI